MNRLERVVVWLLLTIGMCGCGGQVERCEAPCPGASRQATFAAATICWCGSSSRIFKAVDFGPECDAQRSEWLATEQMPCASVPGGHPP